MWNEQILHNERKTDNQDSNPRPYSQAAPASSHHNRNLPLILGWVKNVMKGYCPPTSMGLPITLITHLFLVYKLTKLYDVTQVTSRQIESLDEILLRGGDYFPSLFCQHGRPELHPTIVLASSVDRQLSFGLSDPVIWVHRLQKEENGGDTSCILTSSHAPLDGGLS